MSHENPFDFPGSRKAHSKGFALILARSVALLALCVTSLLHGGGLLAQDDEFVELDKGGLLRIAVAPRHGGELTSMQYHFEGDWHELIYRARDYGVTEGWSGKAPLLWPAVGITLDPDGEGRGFRHDGRLHPMPPHGFARDREWTVVDRGTDGQAIFVTLTLGSDAGSRLHYPFDFELRVTYRLFGERLTIAYTVMAGPENAGPMPFSIGNHITFKAPLIEGGDPAAVRFRNAFPDQLLRGEDRAFSGRVVPSPFRGEQPLSRLPRRQAISLGGGEGPAELTVLDPSGLAVRLRHWASSEPVSPVIRFNLWADHEEGFFSPEPWLGTQSSLSNGAGLVRLEPGERWNWHIEIVPSIADASEFIDNEESK